MKREPKVSLPLSDWLETCGPRRIVEALAVTCEELALADTLQWRYWIQISGMFADIARVIPAELVTAQIIDFSTGLKKEDRFDA
jgi:hypothetical protein